MNTTLDCTKRHQEGRERERDNFIEINREHDDTCTNKNYNEGLCVLIQGAIQVLRNADEGGGGSYFTEKALRRCNVQCY